MKNITDTELDVRTSWKMERLRVLVGVSQNELGKRLGISKQAVSKMERKPRIGEQKLTEAAAVLGFTPEAVRHFKEENLLFFIENMHQQSTAYAHNFQCSFNPLDKVIELYERLLQLEREKVQLLKNKLDGKLSQPPARTSFPK